MASPRATSPPSPSTWQVEADLLADGRFALERLCDHWRFRHLFPDGPNYALLLAAYQQLDRERTVGAWFSRWRWRTRRRMRRLVRAHVRRDVYARNGRLDHRFPLPRRIPLAGDPDLVPLVVRSAFGNVDPDVRDLVQSYIEGRDEHPERVGDASEGRPLDEDQLARRERGLRQFRESLLNAALADPRAIPTLHGQYLDLLTSAQPTRKRHPVATLLLVRLPLRFLATVFFTLLLAYAGAWVWFNDEVLGRFVSKVVSKNLDGELEIESIHWTPRLIVDLITGTPHEAVARGVRVYEGHKTLELPRGELTAEAEELDVGIVLHEIIPWNRIGIPPRLEIPWVLHFTHVHNVGPMWVRAREVQPDGETWIVGLVSAFRNISTKPARPGYRRISIEVDDLQLTDTRVELDFLGKSGWGADLRFDTLSAELAYTGQFPEEPKLPTLPFRWSAIGHGGKGTIRLLGKELAARDVELENLSMGRYGTPLGDMRIQGGALLADGAPARFDGFLRDALSIEPIGVAFELGTTNAGPLADWFLGPPAPAPDGTPGRRMVVADDKPATLTIAGLLSDPSLRLATQGITVDVLGEPAWALDDVAASIRLERDPVPEMWRDDRPQPTDTDDGTRWIAYFETLRAAGFDGLIRLHGRDQLDHIVLPGGGTEPGTREPLLVSLWFDLDEVNPGKLFPNDITAQSRFSGEADGGVEIHELVLADGGSGGFSRADVRLHGLVANRDAAAGSDGLPSYARADGDVVYDVDRGLDLQGLVVATRGGQVSVQGTIDAAWSQLRGGDVSLRVDDGAAFLREFGQRPYFETLAAELAFAGPLLAPSGSGGLLSIRGPKNGTFAGTNLDQARLSLDRGTLRIRHDAFELLGGRGPLEIDIVLFEGGRVLADPKLRLSLDLDGITSRDLMRTGVDVEAGGLTIRIDDGPGRAVPLSRLEVRAAAKANALTAYGARFVNAHSSFVVDRSGVRVDDLVLERVRSPSPHAAPRIEVPTGRLAARGRIGFENDPSLDLEVTADGIPLSALAAVAGDDLPIDGEIGGATRLAVGGSIARPEVRGTVELRALSAAGIPLGGGVLAFATRDVSAGGGLDARREVTVSGDLTERRRRTSRDDVNLAWHLESTLAFPLESRGRNARAIDAEVVVRVSNLPIDALLRAPERAGLRDLVEGELRDIVAETRVCGARRPLLASCLDQPKDDTLVVAIDMATAWIRPKARNGERTERAVEASGDPCRQSTAICTASPLRAELRGTDIRLLEPLLVNSGGRRGATLELAGSVDLSAAPARPGETAVCTPERRESPPSRAGVDGKGHLDITGRLDLAALDFVLKPLNVQRPKGRLVVDLDVDGRIATPRVRGYAQLADGQELALDWAASADVEGVVQHVPVALRDLALALDGERVEASAVIRVFGHDLRLTGTDGTPSSFHFAGPCAGEFDVRVAGALDGKLAHAILPDTIAASSGKLLVDGLFARGNVFGEGPIGARLTAVGGALVLGTSGANLRMRTDFTSASIDAGRIEIARCSTQSDIPACLAASLANSNTEDAADGGVDTGGHLALLIGGALATSPTRPRDAIDATVGDRGRAGLWGYVVLPPTLDGITAANVSLRLDEVPYLDTDNGGNPQLEIAVSSERLGLTVDEFGSYAVRGDLVIERSRWLRDAQVGTSVLSFADPYPAPPVALPEAISALELELDVRTATPFRADINVVHDLEARAEVTVSGTVSNPEVRGTVDVERGEIDIPILGEPYEIERGRIVLDRDAASSFVDLVAVGREPKNVEGQLRYITLEVQGPLDAIRWGCSALGASGGTLDTTRGCVDYLLFDAGNVEMASADVRRAGSGNQLYGRPLTLVGNLTQIRVDDIISRDLPRTKELIPVLEARVGQLGVETKLATRPEWLQWGWGSLGFGVTYLRGYPGGILRDGTRVTGRFEILDNTAIEAAFGRRNYSQRVLVLDPSRYRAVDFVQTWELPTRR